jgi:hypothetical protein
LSRGSGAKVTRAFSRRAGDQPEVLVVDAVPADHPEIVADVVRLSDDKAGLGGVPAVVEDVDPGRPQPSDHLGVVRLAGHDRVKDDLRHAALVQPRLGQSGQAHAVGQAVVQDRDVLAGPSLGQVVAGDRALHVVAADHAEDVRVTRFGERRVGRRRRDHWDSSLRIHRGGRDRGAGAQMPGDEHRPVGNEFRGHGDSLRAVAEVVYNLDPERLAEDAA